MTISPALPLQDPAPLDLLAGLDRRQLLAALAAAGMLAACGEGPAANDEPAAATRTIDNEFGTFEVPTDPQRVVGWEGRRDLETALALGLSPIAIGSNALDDGELAPFVDTDGLAEADAIVLIANTEDDLAELEASPLWQALPAVQAGRVVVTDFRTNYGSVYAATACLDLLDQAYAALGA